MDQLKLSRELIEKIEKVLVEEDERAKNPLLAGQYLAAIIGFIVGNHDLPSGEKNEIMNELNAFAKYVYDDITKQRQQTMQPVGESFGIWKPGDQ
ncbi:MAG: hypothetical protein KJO81_12170 [Gammaproteobacteria bacterium]|nr:hypothetical protein [Gammaproteobacteria bacterium]MBT8125576.1 hypothetical protein [Gammaproteobacteria bacterium]NNC68763.1 hypothetical protein [Gammaproteobacteria bacterium]